MLLQTNYHSSKKSKKKDNDGISLKIPQINELELSEEEIFDISDIVNHSKTFFLQGIMAFQDQVSININKFNFLSFYSWHYQLNGKTPITIYKTGQELIYNYNDLISIFTKNRLKKKTVFNFNDGFNWLYDRDYNVDMIIEGKSNKILNLALTKYDKKYKEINELKLFIK